jgi:hypothetical protein
MFLKVFAAVVIAERPSAVVLSAAHDGCKQKNARLKGNRAKLAAPTHGREQDLLLVPSSENYSASRVS